MSYFYERLSQASVVDRQRERDEMAALKLETQPFSLKASIAARLVRLAVLLERETTLRWLSPEAAQRFGSEQE